MPDKPVRKIRTCGFCGVPVKRTINNGEFVLYFTCKAHRYLIELDPYYTVRNKPQ